MPAGRVEDAEAVAEQIRTEIVMRKGRDDAKDM